MSRTLARLETAWLSQAQAAEYLGVTDYRTIRNYVSRGHLKATRVRGSRLIRIDRAASPTSC